MAAESSLEEQRSAKQFGAVINSGPQNWQVLQQQDGYAAVQLGGKYFLCQEHENAVVSVRAVEEDTLQPIAQWRHTNQLTGGIWNAEFLLPVGGPYRIESKLVAVVGGRETEYRGDVIRHVYVGDLYAIAGQSNAVGFGREAVCDAPQMGVHVLKGNGCWDIASHPIGDTTGLLRPTNRDRLNPGHSPWLAFAKAVMRRTGMPIGLIPTALGGSPLHEWDHRSGALYGNMLDIVKAAGGKLRGILWYQGCADAHDGHHGDYQERFMRFVQNTREALGQPELPILTVQLNRFVDPGGQPHDAGWSAVREAQRRAATEDDNIFIAVSMDLATTDGIHNSSASNMVIGARVADLALKYIYRLDMVGESPDIESIWQSANDEVTLQFRHVVGKLCYLAQMPPFRVEDDLGEARLIEYEADGATIRLRTERTMQGKVLVSYQAWQNPENLCVFDAETMLPALAFNRMEAELHV